ncbi:helix-turn-helix domain-containing protein, partial [Mesorhizobium sp. M1E.F.Ca.ET.063.01.1.1]|uniref:helix-turn-helix domain-containing protein n=1 Tax=Mesorhizobium sp. M1E.F.Ca.ET.063.01.1.1 TaxID=2496750 RepID=UPI001FE003FF
MRKKRTNDPAGMRRRVLDVAEESFQARGYHASSLGDLTAAAGVTGGALHHHFPTKKALPPRAPRSPPAPAPSW